MTGPTPTNGARPRRGWGREEWQEWQGKGWDKQPPAHRMREATERRRVAEQASANQQTVIEMLLRYAVAPDKQAALEAAGIHRVGEMSKTELSDFLVKMGQALAR